MRLSDVSLVINTDHDLCTTTTTNTIRKMPVPDHVFKQIRRIIPPLNGRLHKGQSGVCLYFRTVLAILKVHWDEVVLAYLEAP